MVKQRMYQQIQNYKRRGYGISAVAEELKLDRKTTAKYFHMSEGEYGAYRQQTAYRRKGFDAYEEQILELYDENGNRKLNVAAVYDYLEEVNGSLQFSEKTLRNYIRFLIDGGKLVLTEAVRMYQSVPPLRYGKQMQMDFGQYRCASGLILYIFSVVLSASRYKYMIFQDHRFTTEDVIRHMLNCFDNFGGIVEEVVIDQDALLVVSENHGDIIFTHTFSQFIDEMDLSMYVCRAADPESKGKVEHTIKYVKYNFLAVRDFTDVDEANESLHRWLIRRANGKISQATKRIPSILIEHEREYLRPVKNSIFRKDDRIGRDERQVNEHSYISVSGSLYSVPAQYRGRTVEIYVTEQKLFIFDPIDAHQIGEHTVSAFPGATVRDRSHFRKREYSTRQLVEQTVRMFDVRLWKEFLRVNAKKYPRYVRDQCLEASKHFSADIDGDLLEKSIHFCLENQTVSFANLKDTYEYLRTVNEGPQEIAIPLPEVELPKVQVMRRTLEEYRQIAGTEV